MILLSTINVVIIWVLEGHQIGRGIEITYHMPTKAELDGITNTSLTLEERMNRYYLANPYEVEDLENSSRY